MVKIENECVGCPPEMGCIGVACPKSKVKRYFCDACGEEVETLYDFGGGEELCGECILNHFTKVR